MTGLAGVGSGLEPFVEPAGLTVVTGHRTRQLIRTAGPAMVLAVILVGCGGHSSSEGGHVATTTRSSGPTSSPPQSGADIPVDFPLAQGLRADSENTVTEPRRDVRGISLRSRCWNGVWPGRARDRLVTQQRGPELGVTRELVVYADAATAAAEVARVRTRARHCHASPARSEQATLDVTPYDGVGARSRDVGASFAETLAGGQPGGSVFVFTRVGRAILAVEDSSEWTSDSAADGIRHLQRADRDVVARLCVFTDAGC